MLKQELWETHLEQALASATQEQVLNILEDIKRWTCGYCITCGYYIEPGGGKKECDCLNKGEWY